MANPQVEQGYIRISNELWDEILRRDFSKRQQKIILFIWRLSYGTGQKDCEIEQFNMLELAGMYKSDIKKELKYLRDCAVLDWDEDTMVFSIKKNYKLWQISPNKNWDNDKFKSLIHHNLSRKKVSKTLTPRKTVVSKTLTFKSNRVSETLTLELVKHLPGQSLVLSGARYTSALKTVLKTLSTKDIKDSTTTNDDAIVFYQNNFGMLRPHMSEEILDWINDFGDEMVIVAMKRSLERNKPSLGYTKSILKSWQEKNIKSIDQAKAEEVEFQNQQSNNNKKPFYSKQQSADIVPDWFKNRDNKSSNQPKQQKGQEEIAKEQQELAELLKQYS